MRRFLQLSVPIAVLAMASLSAETFSRKFEASPGGLLTVRAERTSIEVYPGSGAAQIEVISTGGLSRIEEDYKVSIQQAGNQILVDIDYLKDGSGWFGSWGLGRQGLKVIARVPGEFNVDLKTSGGSISVEELKGEVVAATSGGGISLGRIAGPVRANTSGGSISLAGGQGSAILRTSGGGISIGDVQGDVDAETSGGSIRIENATGAVRAETSGGGITVQEVAGSIQAHTSGGSIQATISRQPDGDCILSTSGGGVDVRLAPGLGFDLDAQTSGGRVRSNYPGSPAEGDRSRLQGRVNQGGPKLVLKTSGGSVSISSM